MALGLGISGIGYPAMGLGTFGLGASGSYSSYDNYMPSMLGMNPMMSMGYGYGGMNSMMGVNPMMGGMMGMYNPLYYTQMRNAAEQIQAQHSGNMHTTLLNNAVNAQRETDSALIQKMLTNSDVQQGIENLHNAVKSGNQDDICKRFDELHKYIYSTYKDEFAARGDKNNPHTSATKLINNLYTSIITAQNGGGTADLRSDIIKYGESSTMNGFMKGFRRGHQDRYIDQTLSHCFGDEIEDMKSKEGRKAVASYVGRGASVLEKGAYGAVGGAAAYTVGYGLLKGAAPVFGRGSAVKFSPKWLGKSAPIGAMLAMAADIIWQCTDTNKAVA